MLILDEGRRHRLDRLQDACSAVRHDDRRSAFCACRAFSERLTVSALRRIGTPLGLLAVTIGLSGVLSAFLINDIVCVALTPLVLHLARRLRFDPMPHLIGLATAANIGSTGTITGNPQNIFIGSHSGISYLRFAARLLPVAMLGLGAGFFGDRRLSIAGACSAAEAARRRRRNVRRNPLPADEAHRRRAHRWLRRKAWRSRWRRWCCFLRGCRWNWSPWARRP